MKLAVALLPLMLVMIIPSALALSEPEVTFIPDKITANASFLMLVDPMSTDSVRITWLAPYCTVSHACSGQIPKMTNSWVCYFSNTDPDSTCGPSPFSITSEEIGDHPFEVNATNAQGESIGTELNVTVGGIPIIAELNYDSIDNILNITAYAQAYQQGIQVNYMKYSIYKEGDYSNPVVSDKTMTKTYVGSYVDTVSNLENAVYYLAFKTQSSDDFGGNLTKIIIGGSTGNGTVISGDLEVESFVFDDILLEKNREYEDFGGNFEIKSLSEETLGNLSVNVSESFEDYISISLSNTSIEPDETIYYRVTLDNFNSKMEILTRPSIISTSDNLSTVVGKILINITVSVKDSGPCTPDWNCTDWSECENESQTRECEDLNECKSDKTETRSCGTSDLCSEGYCNIGISCPSDETATGEDCELNGEEGVCCIEATSGCEDRWDCESDEVCCYGECIVGDCCYDDDCATGYVCSSNECVLEVPDVLCTDENTFCETSGECGEGYATNGEDCVINGEVGICCVEVGEIDFMLIIIILAVIVGAGAGGFILMKKLRGKSKFGEEFEEPPPEEEEMEGF